MKAPHRTNATQQPSQSASGPTGLILQALQVAGADRFRSGNAVFDLSKLHQPRLKLQVGQALDLGFEHRNGTPLMAETTHVLENAASRGVRFFSIEAEAIAGTTYSPSAGGEGGSAMWQIHGRWGSNILPVTDREDMRVFMNPSGGYYSPRGDGFDYNRLVHVLWHELHHLATTQHHERPNAPYANDDPWVGAMVEIARAFPSTARDPETGRNVLLFAPGSWTENQLRTNFG